MSAHQIPTWLGHETQVSIAASLPGVYRRRDEAERLAARLKAIGAPASAVHHFKPDNYAVIAIGTEEHNVPALQARIDEAIATAAARSTA